MANREHTRIFVNQALDLNFFTGKTVSNLEVQHMSEKSKFFGHVLKEEIRGMKPKYSTYATARVKRHILKLPVGEPFATRDLLSYGKRDTIDKALQRMVKKGWIIRLARGVFIRSAMDGSKCKLPSLVQIAQTKARAFGKELFIDGRNGAQALQLVPKRGEDQTSFIASGCSTSFKCTAPEHKERRIYFKSVRPGAIKLADGKAGQVIRAFMHIGAREFNYDIWNKVRSKLYRSQFDELKDAIKWMPMWMSDVYWRAQSEIERARVKRRRDAFLTARAAARVRMYG